MSERIDKKELITRVSRRVCKGNGTVGEIVDATLEEIYAALKRGECVSLRGFGTFYVWPERSSWCFRFNPSQRLRKVFGQGRLGATFARARWHNQVYTQRGFSESGLSQQRL